MNVYLYTKITLDVLYCVKDIYNKIPQNIALCHNL